jgi:hypothetical protein
MIILVYFTEKEKMLWERHSFVSVCACDTIKGTEYFIVFHDNVCEVFVVWGQYNTITVNYLRSENPKILSEKCR